MTEEWLKELCPELADWQIELIVEQVQKPAMDYAWPTIEDYEKDVGFQVNQTFRMAWGMARTTNKMLGIMAGSDAQAQ